MHVTPFERVTGTHGIQSSHVGRTRASSDQAGRTGRQACCVLLCAAVCCGVLQCAAVCCSHHCLHSYPRLRSQHTPFQVRVHMSESQVISLCVSTSYPCVCVEHIPVRVCLCLCVSKSMCVRTGPVPAPPCGASPGATPGPVLVTEAIPRNPASTRHSSRIPLQEGGGL